MADFSVLKNYPLATGAQINGPDDVKALVAAGVTAVLDCQIERDDTPLLFAPLVDHYCWDGRADDGVMGPSMDPWWRKGLAFASVCFDRTGLSRVPVQPPLLYAHCAAGINRGPSMAFAALRAVFNVPAAEAEAAIREVRPQVGIAYRDDFERYWAEQGNR